MDTSIFKAYDIRGIYREQFDEDDTWKIGYACARFLPSLLRGYERGQVNAQSVCVGRDMRTHSESLAQALIEGINSAGVNVIDIGMIDTPQMYFAINHFGTCGGIQVTASHNPAKYNGFKISGLEAKPVGENTGLKEIQHIATGLPHTKGKSTGTVKNRNSPSNTKTTSSSFFVPTSDHSKLPLMPQTVWLEKLYPNFSPICQSK